MDLSQLTNPIAVREAMREFDKIGRSAFLAKYGFKRAREYKLRGEDGRLYDLKAIAGVAIGYQYPDHGSLQPDQFSGGEIAVQRILASLGFEVVRIGHNWTAEEVRMTVVDYFDMLERDARGEPYSKVEHNEQLRRRMPARSKGSIELKHQNISAVLNQLGLPYIPGYKPRSNVQGLLREVVRAELDRQQGRCTAIMDALEQVQPPSQKNFRAALVNPPKVKEFAETKIRKRLPRKFDHAARDARNRSLGCLGEQWVFDFESFRLAEGGRPDLVRRIEWTTQTKGDGAGYDIGSFSEDDAERFIEVKTTNGAALTPFIVSANELEFSREVGELFFLYRVFEFSRCPYLFWLQGNLDSSLHLESVSYRARLSAILDRE